MLFVSASDDRLLIHRLIVQPSSSLTIDGATNVNRFQCAIARYAGNDTLVLHEGVPNTRPVFVKGSVGLDASSFDCGLALMTSDFLKTINANKYPSIVIDFISFERTPQYEGGGEEFKGILKISIGGVTRLFEVDCAIETSPSGIIHLTGSKDFTFKDFGMTPPTRALGFVKAKETLNVNFKLQLLLDTN